AGWRRSFLAVTGTLVVVTTIGFNPLVHGTDALDQLELTQVIRELNRESQDPPLWVCYGGRYSGTVVSLAGGRSATGVAVHPPTWWRRLDPAQKFEACWNRYAHVSFSEMPSGQALWMAI